MFKKSMGIVFSLMLASQAALAIGNSSQSTNNANEKAQKQRSEVRKSALEKARALRNGDTDFKKKTANLDISKTEEILSYFENASISEIRKLTAAANSVGTAGDIAKAYLEMVRLGVTLFAPNVAVQGMNWRNGDLADALQAADNMLRVFSEASVQLADGTYADPNQAMYDMFPGIAEVAEACAI